jgi:Secretion system C-terminal sorting domain
MRTIAIILFATLGWFRSANAEDIHLRIAPNPASANVVVSMPELAKGTVTIEIFTVLGSKISSTIYQVEAGFNSVNLSTAQLPDGIYLVRVSQNDNTSVKRLKVQHTE